MIKDWNEFKNESDQATLEAHKLREELSMDRERNAQEVRRLKVVLDECHFIIKHLKYEKKGDRISHVAMIHRLLKEKDELSRMVDMYSREMRQKLDEVEVTNKRVQEDHDKVDEGVKRTFSDNCLGNH